MSWITPTLCFFFLFLSRQRLFPWSQDIGLVAELRHGCFAQASHVLGTRRQVAQKKSTFPVPFEKSNQAAGRQVRNAMLRHIDTRGQHPSVLGISKTEESRVCIVDA